MKYFITMLSAVLTIFIHHHHGSGKESKDIPLYSSEPHWEEPFYNDYLSLNMDRGTSPATGTSTVLTFHMNNSDLEPN